MKEENKKVIKNVAIVGSVVVFAGVAYKVGYDLGHDSAFRTLFRTASEHLTGDDVLLVQLSEGQKTIGSLLIKTLNEES